MADTKWNFHRFYSDCSAHARNVVNKNYKNMHHNYHSINITTISQLP